MVIYIHIPFCIKKCSYCDFLSAPCDGDTRARYIDALINEIEYYGKRYGRAGKNIPVNSVFFGGGTPSAIDGEHIANILGAVREHYYIVENAEVTVECNPGTIDEHKLACYREAGVNRLSIGLQSADDDELKSIGRIHTYEEFVSGYRMAREQGFKNINIDIMSALPNQTVESYGDTLRKVIELKPEHISAYSLILEEGTPLYEKITALENAGQTTGLPDEDTEREMYYMTGRLLGEAGYHRYEISNYATDGLRCYHNMAYWKREDYLGLGLGASSCMENVRTKNITDLNKYIDILSDGEKQGLPEAVRETDETIELSEEDMMAEFMFLGLRMTEGVSKAQFNRCFSRDYNTVYGKLTDKLIGEGLMEMAENGDNLRLTELGVDVSNMVMCQFLPE